MDGRPERRPKTRRKRRKTVIVQRMFYALLLCAALCGAASAETAPRKMYVSALAASGVGARIARAVTDALVLALLGRADERRRVLGDDDIRALYRRAETAMAAGKGADEQVREIADAVEADEIVYGEVRAEGGLLRIVVHCMARQGAKGFYKKSMVDFTCAKAELAYCMGEAVRALIEPSYRMAVKSAAPEGLPPLAPIAVLRFDVADGAMAAALSFLKDELAAADASYETGRAEEALAAYGALLERVDGRLSDEHRRSLAPFRAAVRERMDAALAAIAAMHDAAGDGRYRAWEFAEARLCYEAALSEARKINGAARRVPLEKALVAKSAAAAKTGENHLNGRVRTLVERALAANLRDELAEASAALSEARSCIIDSAFFSADAFRAYNEAARRVGGENPGVIAPGEHGIFITRAGALIRDREVLVDDVCERETEGRAASPRRIKKGERYGLIDTGGRIMLDFVYDEIDCYGDGLARFKSGGRWGYLNDRGAVRLPAVYDEAESFSEGRARVRRGTLWTWINATGATDPDPDDLLDPVYCGEKGLYGYADGEGRVFIAHRYEDARAFEGNLAAVRLANGWGFINRRGTLVAGGWYDEVRGFAEGRVAVKKYGFWGYIDSAGNIILHCTLDEAGDLAGGKADITFRGCRGTAYRNGYFEYYTWR